MLTPEQIQGYLKDPTLVQILTTQMNVSKITKELISTKALLSSLNFSEKTLSEVQEKIDHYTKIDIAYDVMLEDCYGLGCWRKQAIYDYIKETEWGVYNEH